MINALKRVPIKDSPQLRKLLRQRCPHGALVRLATGGWFELVNIQAMKRGETSYLVRGLREHTHNRVYVYVLEFNPRSGKPIAAGMHYLWSD
jgi:hypothetical protein